MREKTQLSMLDVIHEESPTSDPAQLARIERIRALDLKLAERFAGQIETQQSLTRQLVSFQANKKRPAYRWYKYNEAFSATFVEKLLGSVGIERGRLLDPFAGA